MSISDLDKVYTAIVSLPRLMSQAATDAADLLQDTIHAQFDGGHDPYGQAWAPKADGSACYLTDEGALGSVEVEAMQGSGITVTYAEDYATYHQTGTSRMPARKIVPDEGNFNASLWYPPLIEAYSNAILKNGGWRAAGGSADDKLQPMAGVT